MPARCETVLLREVSAAKVKFGLPADAEVVACYEAGRDGFWIARMLQNHRITCRVMDPASIEVPRRSRARKTDRLDAQKLLRLLLRAELWGESEAYSAVRVPDEEQEAQMRVHRERERLVKERTGHRARIKSLLVLHGIEVGNPATVDIAALRDWEGKELKALLRDELQREQQRLCMVETQLDALEKRQAAALADPQTPPSYRGSRRWGRKAAGCSVTSASLGVRSQIASKSGRLPA
jgi:transposase